MGESFDALVKRTTTPATRRKAARLTREFLREMLIAELRALTGMTQKKLADALGVSQPAIAKIERQSDIQLSTLAKIVHALGGELEVRAVLPQGESIKIALPPKKRKTTKVASAQKS